MLRAIANGIAQRRDVFVQTLVDEAGKPRKLAHNEVDRAIATFDAAAAVLLARSERMLPLDGAPLGGDRTALVRDKPRGVVVAITPFNFPLNLVAHKLAPAFAAGCPVVLKPAEQTPLSSLLLARVCQEAGVPDGGLSVVPCDRSVAADLVKDPRIAVVSFTGSDVAGCAIKHATPARNVVLELGGDASVIIADDVDDADLDRIAARLVTGAFAYAGQVCISVQHVWCAQRHHDGLRERLVAAANAVEVGDPSRDDLIAGPVINDAASARIRRVVGEAIDSGGRALTTSHMAENNGRLMAPTVIEGASPSSSLMRDEVFGPVVTIDMVDTIDSAFARVNASRFGLQCGVFTNDVQTLWRASDVLDVGAVIHDDVPTFRVDHMPYGGTKASGQGREGLPWAIDDYVEPHTLVLRRLGASASKHR